MGQEYRVNINAQTIARFQAIAEAEAAYKKHLQEYGRKLAYSGLCLIPSAHLRNDQMMVSQEIYDTVKEILFYDGEFVAPPNDPPSDRAEEQKRLFDEMVDDAQNTLNELEYSDE